MKLLYAILVLFCLGLQISSCSKDDDGPDCDTSNITYTNTVKAIFDANCTTSGCHNSGSINGSLASFDDAKNFPNLGKMKGAINHQPGFVAMPQGGTKLADCTIDKIEAWIDAGTPN